MPCSTCHDFQGIGDYLNEDVLEARHRHHIKLGLTWGDLVTSATTCELCDILLRGCQGSFQQRDIDESQVLHCHISFYYDSYEKTQHTDIDKEIFFRMKDGSWFTLQIFSDPDGKRRMD